MKEEEITSTKSGDDEAQKAGVDVYQSETKSISPNKKQFPLFMKNINYLISAVLAVCVIILFILHFSSKKESAPTFAIKGSSDSIGTVLPVAYVRLDSLLVNYNFSKDVSEALLKKHEDSRLAYTQRARQLQSDMNKFQEKIQNNAFLSRERAEAEQQALIRKQQDLQKMEQDLSNDFAKEQQKLNDQLKDSITLFLKEYNKIKKYQLILTGEAVLQGEDAYDITKEVVDGLNARYPEKEKKK
ncbi:MAG: OmpH family outer membrane protein [Candidatus Azobacteroides sp.]|nr:OmpH family outer membrane protein [Candidatus Azobacteroides sp.]